MVMGNAEVGRRTGQMTGYFKVADFVFAVTLRRDCDLVALLPSFRLFRWEGRPSEKLLFEFVEGDVSEDSPNAEFLEEDNNDMGMTRLYRVGEKYRVDLRYSEACHVMEASPDFSRVSARLRWDDQYVSAALCSMLRIVFAQAAIMHSAVSLHSSVVVKDGQAYMFMGRSGTGKSTHSRLWLEHIDGSWILNDDNPIVRLVEGRAMVYGSPWSGKTPCFLNESAPVAAMVRLVQAKENRFERKSEVEAFSLILPGCSVLRHDERLYGSLCETLIELTGLVCVGEMRCLPDRNAAQVCQDGVNKESV
jgi:hypothetical protein